MKPRKWIKKQLGRMRPSRQASPQRQSVASPAENVPERSPLMAAQVPAAAPALTSAPPQSLAEDAPTRPIPVEASTSSQISPPPQPTSVNTGVADIPVLQLISPEGLLNIPEEQGTSPGSSSSGSGRSFQKEDDRFLPVRKVPKSSAAGKGESVILNPDPPMVTEMIDGDYIKLQETATGKIVKCEHPETNGRPETTEWNITLDNGRKFNVEGIVPKEIRTVLNSAIENTKTNDPPSVPIYVLLKHDSIDVDFPSQKFWKPADNILRGSGHNRSAGPSTPNPLGGVTPPSSPKGHGLGRGSKP